ncbi:HAD family hydrolase [Trinickia symbiotica]|uniref:D,D-heptose 1,7-bisphosphate phosphatase n=1 Tax=Trinickia symbiotica TaxID=863227 RepID=A0A2T3Y163_9BURK|nr:HAD family hydrolase [Trinickia symbiotica]PTB22462.1 HAD family hydrolase [Trinickia symbiotica]
MLEPAVFLDKDGTLLDDVPYNVDPTLMRFAPGAPEALSLLGAQGFALFVVSNQSGVALGRFPFEALADMESHLRAMFAACGVGLRAALWCPHHPKGVVPRYAVTCHCRKPAPGLIMRAAREHPLDMRRSWFVGDILDDVEAGSRAGCRTILIDNGNETEWRDGPLRRPTLRVPDIFRAALAIAESTAGAAPRHAAPTTPVPASLAENRR